MRIWSTEFLEKASFTMPQMLGNGGAIDRNEVHDRWALTGPNPVTTSCSIA